MDSDVRKFELIVIIIILFLSIIFVFEALKPEYNDPSLSVDSATLPLIVFWGAIISCIIMLISYIPRKTNKHKLQKGDKEQDTSNSNKKILSYIPSIPKKTIIVMLLIIIYVAIMNKTGFLISSILLTITMSWVLSPNKKSIKTFIGIALLAILLPLAIHMLFGAVFQVKLP